MTVDELIKGENHEEFEEKLNALLKNLEAEVLKYFENNDDQESIKKFATIDDGHYIVSGTYNDKFSQKGFTFTKSSNIPNHLQEKFIETLKSEF